MQTIPMFFEPIVIPQPTVITLFVNEVKKRKK